jgi:uncharacterized protein YbjT (DUF2867 family)
MSNTELKSEHRVLVLGATGFVGRRLVKQLAGERIKMRLFARDPSEAEAIVPEGADAEIVQGDLISITSLKKALKDIHSAFYLVHSLGSRSVAKNIKFAERDIIAASYFINAADTEGLKRVIYIGGLGEKGSDLSEHLKSRAEVATILSSGKPEATILRAAVIIGAGGTSFEMLRYLVERMPVMTCPKWINTRIQPIAVKDVIQYLLGCLMNPETAGKTFDIGGPDVLTYKIMMEQYAKARGLSKRLIIGLPFITPALSAFWVGLVTPIPSGVAHPLIDGLKNEVICRDNCIDEYVPIKKSSFVDAVKTAFSEETSGPGKTGF